MALLETLLGQFSSLEATKYQQEACARLAQLGLPEKKQEAFQYVHLRELYAGAYALPKLAPLPAKEEISSFILPECEEAHIVFVDGNYAPELSVLPAGLIVTPLSKALHTYQTLLQQRLSAAVSEESDPFALLNLTFASQGAFVYLPPKNRLTTPVQFLHLITQKGAMASPRLHVFVGRESELKIVSTFHPLQDGWINHVLDLTLEEGARVEQANTLLEASPSWLFDATRATLKQDSYLHAVSASRGGKSHRQSFKVTLMGANAEADLNGTWLLDRDFSSHTHVQIDHAAPHTRSRQLFKGVVDEISQSSFEGKIFVHPIAQKTEAYQLNNNLILGERAQAYSKPNLQIFADDVKASHGATIGQLDASALFYLKTRGIPEALATRLLVRAFCQEIGAKLPLPSLQSQFAEQLNQYESIS